ncbi:LysR family transcriptional regulator [Pseudonocardia sp. 73-21]|uniref:LysR family transcriptional regulator n=1 Tax=Pseudonocardia sp. 73-21 TaxID=1895809 RepID=UPI00095AF3F5|nr:LysR family transcriptional regulator [Pseudonocardia sp. 73-21]OJY53560.1 MAG: hypothetical protein BGP03_34095 [Pseudonocardia sp. 73-21]
MNDGQLRAFVAVADNLHFGKAAEHLRLAQPYLSRTIRSLEDEMGAALFARTTRRVELTAAGRALLDPAHRMLALQHEAQAQVTAAVEGRSGRVRIGFAGPSAHVAVGRLARAVREQYPLVDLDLRPGTYGTTALADLARGDIDLGLARFTGTPPGVASQVVEPDRCVFAVPVGHRLADAGRMRFVDLRDEPLVAFPESHGSAVRALHVTMCEQAGFAPRFVQAAPDSWTCMALVAAGVGLHFTTASAVAQLPLDGVRIVEVQDTMAPIAVHLVWRSDDDGQVLHRVLATATEVLPGT